MGATHFLILSEPKSVPHLRVARTPQGPTLTFEIQEYALSSDVARAQTRPRCPQGIFNNSPLIVLSGFGSGGQHLKLTTIMFQNIFPAIDINTVNLSSCQRIVLLNYNTETKLIDFRHYSIRLQPIGVSRRIRKFVQSHHVPDLRNMQDVSDFVTKAGYGSESEADEESATLCTVSALNFVFFMLECWECPCNECWECFEVYLEFNDQWLGNALNGIEGIGENPDGRIFYNCI